MWAMVALDLKEREELTLWVLGGSGGVLRRSFRAQTPRTTGTPLYSNPNRIRARADAQFTKPLLEKLRTENATAHASYSPIWQSLAQFGELGEFEQPRVRLVLISDLRQHDPAVHREMDTRVRLDHVSVLVLFVSRPGVSLDEELRLQRQWRSDLTSSGAQSVRFERL
jgi:hypothetical protein